MRGGSKKAKNFANSDEFLHTLVTTLDRISPRWHLARTLNRKKEKRLNRQDGVSEDLEEMLNGFRRIIASQDLTAQFMIDRLPNMMRAAVMNGVRFVEVLSTFQCRIRRTVTTCGKLFAGLCRPHE